MNDDHVAIPVNNSTATSSMIPPVGSIGVVETGASSQVMLSSTNLAGQVSVQVLQEREEEKAPLLDESSVGQDTARTVVETSERNQNFRGFSRYLKMVIPDLVRSKGVENKENQLPLSDMVVGGHGSHPRGVRIDVKVNDNQENPHVSTEISSSGPSLESENGCNEGNHSVEHIDNGLIGCSKQHELGIKPTVGECRICQEEDDIANLESPCACSGSLKFAHRKCVQHWCDEKGDTVCEICKKPFEGGYVTTEQADADSIPVNIGTGWDIASGQPRIFALAADQHFLDAEYDEYAGSQAHSAACFRSVALMLVALLLLRHILSMTGADDEDASTFFMLSLVRAAGFLIPCYIMARAMNALQIRRQRQEAAIAAAAAAAVEVRYLIQASQAQAAVSHGNPA